MQLVINNFRLGVVSGMNYLLWKVQIRMAHGCGLIISITCNAQIKFRRPKGFFDREKPAFF